METRKKKATTAGDAEAVRRRVPTDFHVLRHRELRDLLHHSVSNGVDVAGLLGKIGIEPSQNAQTGGTFAIAYAAHKAASPIRFPPTVALTPVVAKMLGKDGWEVGGGGRRRTASACFSCLR